MQNKKDIRSFSLEQLTQYFISINEKPFRAKQVYEWLWNKGAYEIDDMTNISKSLRKKLKHEFVINHIKVDRIQRSTDGTIKNAIKLFDGNIVESVLIPTESRSTACVSSQVGCSLDCNFCATAQLKRIRNLNPDEIYDQVITLDEQSRLYYNRPLSNIVFMGMGEPLMNYNNVMKAIKMITSDKGLGMSPRRIVVSTSGIPKMIKKMADENPKFGLAVSLHSVIDEIRTNLMPFNTTFPLKDLKEALIYWYEKTKSRVTYEYVVWKGINDTIEDVKALIQFCKIIPCKVNLIEYNSIGNDDYKQASNKALELYEAHLERNQIIVNIRRSRGKDIDAACGQLANKKS